MKETPGENKGTKEQMNSGVVAPCIEFHMIRKCSFSEVHLISETFHTNTGLALLSVPPKTFPS